MNQTKKHTTGKKLLALLLALIMSVSLLPMSVFAADLGTEAPIVEGQTQQDAALDESSGEEEIVDSQEPVVEDPAPVEEDTTEDVNTLAAEGDVAVQADAFTVDETTALTRSKVGDVTYRAVMLDCGRKYFSVANIEKLIDTMAQYGYNQLQLSFGNGGCRFLLDDMSLSFKGVTMSSDTVKANITNGNYNFNGDKRCLTETDMDAIIAYANNKGIEIVPMLNMPGHATAIVYDTSYSNNGNLNVTDETARYYGYALLNKYVQYFKTAGCKYFSFGSDESGYTGTNMTAFLTGCANVIVGAGMTPRAFNDATNVATMPTSVQITYWHQESGSKTASALANAGYEMINTHGRWYYVIKTAQNSEIGTKYWQGTVNQTATSVELPVMKAEKMDKKWVGLNEYFDGNPGYGSTVSGSKGTMFCIWCDASQDAYLKDSDVISENENYGALYQLEKLAEHYWPDDIKKTTAPVVTTESGAAVPTTMTANGTVTLKASESVTWTTSNENVIKLESVSVTRSASVTGTSVKATAVGTGKATITATNASKETVSYTINVQDAAAATTKNVTLKVGESKTFTDIDTAVGVGDKITGNTQYIATAKVAASEAQAADTKVITSTTEISADKKYLIVNNRTRKVLTSDDGTWGSYTGRLLNGTASATNTDWWKITGTTGGFAISYNGDTSKYLTLGNNTSSLGTTVSAITLYYKNTDGYWNISQGNYYLNNLGGGNMAGGWYDTTGDYDEPTDEGSKWTIYEIVEETTGGNTLTITGTGEGKTTVTVGNVTYEITVTAPETTETKALSYGTSFTLPEGADATITEGEGVVSIANGKVTAGQTDGTAIVTAVVKNAGKYITARYIYNVTVAAVDFGTIDPLSVELWITNSYIGETSSPTSLQYHSITAEEAYGETGTALGDLVVSPAYRTNDILQRYYYWKGVVLHDGLKQEVGKDSRVYAGDDFTQIRWNGAWQYLHDGEWKTIVGTDTVIAYYLQKFEVSPEINTYTRDFGNNPRGEQTPNWDGDYDGFSGVAFAVVYPDGTISRSEETMYKTCEVLYSNQNSGTSAGIIWAENNSNYAISKITATRGTHTVEYPGTGANSGAWTQNGEITWEKVTTDAGKPWYDEVTVWNKDSGTEPVVNFDGLEVDGKNFTLKKDEALLVLIYLEVEYSPNNLNLVYWDEAAGKQINPKDIQIVVPEDVTYINGLKNVTNPAAGEIELPDNAYIVNSDNVPQTINKDITILTGVAANYKSGIYKYVRAEISDDGMTLTLYYNLKEVASEHQFVVDFGLPVNFTGLLSWFNLNNSDTVNYLSVATGYKLTVSTGSWGSIKIDESTWDSMTYTLDKMLSAAATIPLYCNLDDGRQFETRIKVIPASTVYYEDSFAKFYGSNGAEQTSFNQAPTDGTDTMGTWYVDGADVSGNFQQALEELGKKQNVYGYDPAYKDSTTFSMGSAKKVTVDASVTKAPTATFTFKGTGFDIISLTDNNSGAIVVDVVGKNSSYNESLLVNSYYGYVYNEETGEWKIDNTAQDNALYQIPVMKVTGLDYDEYTVTINVGYGKFFDKTGDSQYSFWLDAIRVYDPMGKDYADYTQDQEGYPQYIKLRAALAKDAASVDDTNLLFIDGAEKAEVSLYKNYGPNNEVYLASGQAISFKLTGELSKIATIQVGAKKPSGTGAVMTVNGTEESVDNSATEMYYTITRNTNNCVTIANTGADILSLTNLKVTFNEKATVALEKYSTQEQTEVVAAVQALFAAPVEPDPEPVVFAPEYFQATWNRSTVKVGQKATLTVKTSADVETVTVNGQDISNYRVRTERTGWGWNAKKVTYHVFTFTVTATEAGTLDYSVIAANAEGVNSEAITATLTVQAAAQRPGFGGWLDKIFSRWF